LCPRRNKQDSKAGWTLCCRPETEAGYFASKLKPERWQSMRRGEGPRCPMRILIGRHSDIPVFGAGRGVSHFHKTVFAGTLPGVVVEVVDQGHMGPLEHPAIFACEILSEVAALTSRQSPSQVIGHSEISPRANL
jgi:pimeloyl-ACP methyl ester carboxylesterase